MLILEAIPTRLQCLTKFRQREVEKLPFKLFVSLACMMGKAIFFSLSVKVSEDFN